MPHHTPLSPDYDRSLDSPRSAEGERRLGEGRRVSLLVQLLTMTVLAVGGFLTGGLTPAFAQAADPCAAPANAIVAENCKPGDDPSVWDVSGAGDLSLQGFATDMSVNTGELVRFKVKTTAAAFRLDIYRMGFYGGKGARKITTVQPSASLPQAQPNCLTQAATGLVDCGNWAVSASWQVPATAVSGIYFAKLVRSDTGGASHIPFIVRDDSSGSDLLFQTADTTWQAYNDYGGNSLYTGSPAGRAYKVSYNRPMMTRGNQYRRASLFNAEYPMVRWLEANGYDVSYSTGVDSDRRGAELREHKTFLSVGHDEYWSAGQRANVEAARNAGVNLAFFSGNEVFWKTRWENAIDGSGTSHRTLVSYKETKAGAKIDPEANVWTGTWRDPRFSPPADGGRPENALTGTIFTVNCCQFDPITVSAVEGKLRFWRNTGFATLAPGTTGSTPNGLVGYEWDEDLDNGSRPAGLFRLSSTTVDVGSRLRDYGDQYAPGRATHSLTLYRHSSGALVFGAGTIQWSWGLDVNHDNQNGVPLATDANVKQATVNLFADMGVQPGSLQAALTAATASTDTAKPTSSITAPAAGARVQAGGEVTISGTATDAGGGKVGGVEVSTDAGDTWNRANGRDNWSYTWTPTQDGSATIKSRAVDDSGNLESPSAGVSVTIAPRVCPCSIWSDATVPAVVSADDTSAVELGLKFRSDSAGFVTGVRFYKGAGNTGTHVGSLWTSTGTRLASATFAGETASGWQQVSFGAPVQISADTTYIVSYHAPVGRYAATGGQFASSGVTNAPLRALASGVDGLNGLYRYGAAGNFPTESYNSTNYWVDVVFTTTTGGPSDTTPPAISAVQAGSITGTSATVTWTTNEDADSQVEYGPTSAYGSSTTVDASRARAHSVALSGLTAGTLYHYRVKSRDAAGNLATSADNTFTTTATSGSCPCSIWSDATVPAVVSADDTSAVELGLKFRSDSAGFVTGVRFYKGAGNTGTHVGSLWTSTGTRLASATFAGETASGWQQVSFGAPVQISADTTYIVSYHAPVGRYAATGAQFASSGVTNAPLRALASGVDGLNGLYRYGAAGNFPTESYNSTNYWVDVVFTTTTGGPSDTTPPAISAVQAGSITGTSATVSWTTNEDADSQVEYGPTSAYGSSTTVDASRARAHSVALSGLTAGTLYHYRVKSRDAAGNLATSADNTFTTTATPSDATPPTITAVSPASGATGVAVATNITATFSEPMDPSTLTTGTVTLVRQGTTTPIAAAVSYNTTSRQATLNPAANLTAGTVYTATVSGGSSGAKDASGNALAVDRVWSFTTAADSVPPTVTSVAPTTGASGVAVTANTTATFSEAMNPASLTTATIILVRQGTTTPLPAAVSYSATNRRVTLNPSANLARGATYTATVKGGPGGVKDAAGNPLAVDRVWSFTTAR